MAWTNPTTQSTGTLITATIWNTDIVDNLTALRGGSLAITSQAAGDVIYASSSTQLGRVAIGTSGYVLTSNGSAPAWSNTPTLTGTNFTGIPASGVSSGTFAGSTAAVFGGTLAWGGGSAISSSSNVAVLNANNTFSGTGTHGFAGLVSSVQSTVGQSSTQFRVTLNGSNAVGAYLSTITDAGNLSTSAAVEAGRYINDASAPHVFQTSPATSVGAERTWTTRAHLTTAGAWRWQAYGAGTLVTDGSGNVTASSDERLKDITGQFTPGLGAIMGLRPILHRWKAETGYDTENIYASWSAQNVLQFIPEAVGVGLNGLYTVNDRPVILALVNAVQELTAEVDALRAAAQLPVLQRVMQPLKGDGRAIKSATKARLAEVAADESRQREQQLARCQERNMKNVAAGGKPVVCGGVR